MLFLSCLLLKFLLENHYKVRFFINLCLIILVVAVAYVVPIKTSSLEGKQEKRMDGIWQDFSESKIKKYIEKDKIVIVDITAEWCLTCKYNKTAVMNNPFMIRFLRENDIVGLRGDFTNRNEKISQFLKSRSQYGIPYTVVFDKNNRDGIVLPTFLKNSDIINSVKELKKNSK